MPKKFPESVKLEAMRLFIAGDKTAKEIAEIVSKDNDTEVKPVTIYAWAKKDRWGEQKDVARTNEQQKLVESEGQKFARLQQEQLSNYTEVAEKAQRELKGLTFDRALDAVRAIDVGIRGQRDVLAGLINLQFVQDVLGILVEEIDDQDTLNKIAVKLKTNAKLAENVLHYFESKEIKV